ncbi:FkbM family methyltransferase [Allosalinactinospora lopnorensis]|uniref:FkbM family methyltransferase n=1 Tax=Allosalinactinospora lopnorensis TaxID=1352348 RepID=UPI000AC0964E|nr:FkbM family methyltransferase [Allosalinactinospora lopnorensis]
MVPDQVRAFVRRHPMVRQATRKIRVRLPQRLGGIDPARVPPKVRNFELDLPRREGAPQTGPPALDFSVSGDFWVPKRLEQVGLAGYEPETLACFLAVLERARPGAVLDVGANVGLYALLAAARSRRRVYAFEPTPSLAETARQLARANGLDVEVVELAMSNHSGTASLKLSARSDASNSLATGFRPEFGRLRVNVETLSHWRERAETVPAVLKIDTETTEPDVIAGGLEVLRRFRPWVFCEVLPDRGVEERLMALLEPLDYTWHHLCGEPPYPARIAIDGRDSGSHRMWLFAPTPPSGELWEVTRDWRRALKACEA